MHPGRLVAGRVLVGATRLTEQDSDVTVDKPAGQRTARRAGAHNNHVGGEISHRPHTGATLSEPAHGAGYWPAFDLADTDLNASVVLSSCVAEGVPERVRAQNRTHGFKKAGMAPMRS